MRLAAQPTSRSPRERRKGRWRCPPTSPAETLSQLQASWRERMGLLSRFGSWTTNIVHIRRIRRTALTAAQAAESANSQLASISGEISSLRGEISPLRGEIAGIRVELGQVKEGLRRLRRRDSILFVGYAEGGLGLGETFRSMLEALYESGMEFSIYPFRRNIENRLGAPFLPELYDRHGIYDISVAYMATINYLITMKNWKRSSNLALITS